MDSIDFGSGEIEGPASPEGPSGPDGPDGPSGTDGPDGPSGTDGPDGPNESDGSDDSERIPDDIPLEENSAEISDQVHDIDGQNPVEPRDPEVLKELIQGFDLQKPDHVAALKEMIQNLVNDGI
ncbi:MAG: hypothetical protein GWP41_01035 [Planctomycetia bacterium]|nr:hypothetical protein [Planctomycetia bacterium]NCF99004.1 hypothetical protein [Planctomycetia bacterium]